MAEILSNPSAKKQITKIIQDEFEAAKEKTMAEFDTHVITRELSDPENGNISKTLGGYGNLFGFIGFESGFNPISPVRKTLKSIIKFKGTDLEINYPRNKKGQFAPGKRTVAIKVNIQVPDLDDFDEAAQFQGWNGGRNWVKGIERGISGASYFADYPRGRSEQGIQLKGPSINGPANRPLAFKTTKYISEIVNNFKKNFNNKE